MQNYAVFMLCVLGAATAWGAYKGLAWQIASLSSVFVSYAAALRYRATLAPLMPAEAPWNLGLAMLVIFVACNLAIWIAFRFISEILDRVKLKEFDRQLGGMVGFAKGVVLCVIITMFAVSLSSEARRREIVQSRSGHYISILLAKSHSWIPAEARQVVLPHVNRLEVELRRESSTGRPPTADIPAPADTWTTEDAPERERPFGARPDDSQPNDARPTESNEKTGGRFRMRFDPN